MDQVKMYMLKQNEYKTKLKNLEKRRKVKANPNKNKIKTEIQKISNK